MNRRSILIAGAMLAGSGVALGAIGAHAWKEILGRMGEWKPMRLPFGISFTMRWPFLSLGF